MLGAALRASDPTRLTQQALSEAPLAAMLASADHVDVIAVGKAAGGYSCDLANTPSAGHGDVINRISGGSGLVRQLGSRHLKSERRYSRLDPIPHPGASDVLPATREVLIPITTPDRVRPGQRTYHSGNRRPDHLLQ